MFGVQPDSPATATLGLRVLMALLDKEELGTHIIDDVLIFVIRYLHKHKEASFSHDVCIYSYLLFFFIFFYYFFLLFFLLFLIFIFFIVIFLSFLFFIIFYSTIF